MNPIESIKDKLTIDYVIGREFTLKRAGKNLTTEEHDSLSINAEAGMWAWYSQTPGPGQKCLGGDVIDWLAFRRFGRVKPAGEEFMDVMRDACKIAGLDFDELFARDKKAIQKTKMLRDCELSLAAYVECAKGSWSGYGRGLINKTKPWITQDIITAYGLGQAPSVAQMQKAGLDFEQMKKLGLVKKSSEAPAAAGWGDVYPFFRKCMIIPFYERGKVVYITSRRLTDNDGEGKPIPNATKAMSMPNGPLGRPEAYGMDALNAEAARERDVAICEGPLDAIALQAQGQPALAMMTSTPSDALCRRLKRYAGA